MVRVILEASSAPPAARRRYIVRSTALSVLFGGLIIATAILSKSGAGTGLVLALWAACCLALAGLAYEFVALMRSLDELQIRIHLAALAIAFGAVSGVVTMAGMAAGFLGAEGSDWPFLFAAAAMPGGAIGYIIVLQFAQRRYE
ncbi:hypothetical protein DDZ18_04505 [Marinicauda salina]|uniref:Uncharacterized protein n=1 Tax=Marinicauda salina TaxID=2135793 RepID=A0A2U2BXW8_9PROT|nr:hypothetical protein [Marinicauda salina]PWE18856.1 hypothetical protein DDZ18_04505 [Marinicauda salina]